MFNLPRLINLANLLGVDLPKIKSVLDYLSRFGYLSQDAIHTTAIDHFTAMAHVITAVKNFQTRAGIAHHGALDKTTLAKMEQPRCGCPDIQRDVIAMASWRKRSLTYFVINYVNGISPTDQNDIIAQAWKAWTDVAGVKLTPAGSSAADILISTGRGQAQGFDGPLGTLAYAYLPNGQDGQLTMRFDMDERWVKDNPAGGILMLNVATHEFGHLLGLEHSKLSTALMAPIYNPSIATPQAADDIPRIQALYGAATPVHPMPPADPPTDPPTEEVLLKPGLYRVA